MGYKLKKIYIYPDGVTEKQVYPATGWQPGANTLAYYPLENNGNDFSGNNNNLTTFNGITFGTLSSGKKYAIFNGSSSGNTLKAYSGNGTISNTGTTLFWAKPENNGGTYPGKYFMFSCGTQGTYNPNYRLITAWYGTYVPASNDSNHSAITYQSSVSPIVDGNWHHFVVISTSTSISLYIDNVLIGTQSGTITSQTATGQFSLGCNTADITNYGYKGGMSDVIFEKAVRTAQEISDYYNQTKSTYGL